MEKHQIYRVSTSDQGTFGRLILPGLTLFTGELPDRDNAPGLSCIPPGTRPCQLTYSPRFGKNLYLVGPVPGRSGIRKHAANFMGDVTKGLKAQLNGCIALGERLGWIGGQKAVLLSQPAMRRFHNFMGGRPFLLEVINGY